MGLAGSTGGASAPPLDYSRPVRQGADSFTLEGNGEVRVVLLLLPLLLRLPPALSPPVAPTEDSCLCGRTCSMLRDGEDSSTDVGQGATEPPQNPLVAEAAVAHTANTTPDAAIANFPATEHRFMLLFT